MSRPDPREVRIFISYRRKDVQRFTMRLTADLKKIFSDEAVFLDTSHIAPGKDFKDEIQEAISYCDVMLVVIGHNWLTAGNNKNRLQQPNNIWHLLRVIRRIWSDNRNRLQQPDDMVRLEIETAHQADKEIIPVLSDGASMPEPADLPSSWADNDLYFNQYNAASIPHPDDNEEAYRKGLIHLVRGFPLELRQKFNLLNPKDRINDILDIAENRSEETISASDKSLSSETTEDNTPTKHVSASSGSNLSRLASFATIISLIIAIIGVSLTAYEVFISNASSSSTESKPATLTYAPVPTATPNSSDTMRAVYSQLGEPTVYTNSLSDPDELTFAPYGEWDEAVWGYDYADDMLFVVEPHVEQNQDNTLNRWSVVESFGENTDLSAMTWDGNWLWLADTDNERILAFDPTDARSDDVLTPLVDYPVSANISHLVSVETGELWVGLSDQELIHYEMNYRENTLESDCIYNVPYSLQHITLRDSSVLAAYRLPDSSTFRIEVINDNCEATDNPIIVEGGIRSLHQTPDNLWAIVDTGLMQLDDTEQHTTPLKDTGNLGAAFSIQNDVIWVNQNSNELAAYHVETGLLYEYNLPAIITSILVNDNQIWLALRNGEIRSQVIPYMVHDDTLALHAYQDQVWLLDAGGQLCELSDSGKRCQSLPGVERLIAVGNAADDRYLWLALTDNRIARLDLENPDAPLTPEETTGTTVEQLVEEPVENAENRVWILGRENMFFIHPDIMPQTGPMTRAPQGITYGAGQLWIINQNNVIRTVIYRPDDNRLETDNPFQEAMRADGTAITVFENRLYFDQGGQIAVFDIDTEQTLQSFFAADTIQSLLVTDDYVWHVDQRFGRIYRQER